MFVNDGDNIVERQTGCKMPSVFSILKKFKYWNLRNPQMVWTRWLKFDVRRPGGTQTSIATNTLSSPHLCIWWPLAVPARTCHTTPTTSPGLVPSREQWTPVCPWHSGRFRLPSDLARDTVLTVERSRVMLCDHAESAHELTRLWQLSWTQSHC